MGYIYGLSFPLIFTGAGLYSEPSLEDSIESSIRNLLAYDQNNRNFFPDFFAGLYRVLSQPNSSNMVSKVRTLILSAIAKYETRVTVEDCIITSVNDSLIIDLHVKVKETQNTLIISLNG